MTSDAQIRAALGVLANKAGGCPGLGLSDFCDDTKCECREIMRAALEAAEKAAWRPISEAPKGGKHCLVASLYETGISTTGVVVDEAYFDDEEGQFYRANTHSTDCVDGSIDRPFAFRPLPSPPEQSP